MFGCIRDETNTVEDDMTHITNWYFTIFFDYKKSPKIDRSSPIT